MKDLQAIIDQRAEHKFNKDLSANDDLIKKHILYSEFIECCEQESEDFKNGGTLGKMMNDSDVRKRMKKILELRVLPAYKEREAEAFIQEVDALKDKLSSISDEVNSLQYNS